MSGPARREREVDVHRLRIAGREVTLLEGPAGWGECSPLPGYPCDPRRARAAAEEAACLGFPTARRDEVRVNALVTGPGIDPDALAGYDTVKVKLRSPDGVELVARVRDTVGRSIALRVDANGAFDVETALDVIHRLEPLDVELFEQPVPTLEELAEVRRRSGIAVAADECVRDVADARRLRALSAADALVVKVQPLGGVRAALDVVTEAGLPAIPTSMMETSVGLAAGLALACALPDPPLACGLATGVLFEDDVVTEPLVPRDGALARRDVVPDAALLRRYAVESSPSQVTSW